MKIKILLSAVEDLRAARVFYEKQCEGVGDYFFDTLFSDIDSLILYAGTHPKVDGFYRLLTSVASGCERLFTTVRSSLEEPVPG